MSLGERLTSLRKSIGLSQEDVAEKLNVTRQTVSKWELDQSTPDFDKIVPICELFNISTDELIRGVKTNIEVKHDDIKKNKRTIGLVIGILLYFVGISWIMVSIPVINMNPVLASAIFILICGIATSIIVYTNIMYKKEKTKEERQKNKLYKHIEDILSLVTVIIYLGISFTTNAWHMTWFIWLIYALVMEIVKLVISLKDDKDEK